MNNIILYLIGFSAQLLFSSRLIIQWFYSEKENKLVWRGGAYMPLRKRFVKLFYNHPKCNVGQTNSPSEDVPWQKPYMSLSEQLEYKFIFCPEGNDVATNLKWVMSSNSLCFMPRPTCETWHKTK